MTEELLNRSQIDAFRKHLRGVTMPKSVRTGGFRNSRSLGVLFEELPDFDPRHRPAATCEEHNSRIASVFNELRTDGHQVSVERLLGRFAERHQPFLVAFAFALAEALFEIDVI